MVLLNSAPENTRLYRLFGLNLASDYPFSHRLSEGSGAAELSFKFTPFPVIPSQWQDAVPVYSSPNRTPDGESVAHLYRLDSREVLRFPGIADFDFQDDQIVGHVYDPALAETRLLGPVLSYWLERQGIPTLHASAVEINGQAVAFLSQQGGGKSGLAAALMRAGRPLLTDDVLPVEERGGAFLGRPGYPQMRMWPDEAAFFVEGWEGLPVVHAGVEKRRVPVGEEGFGAFHDEALPLGVLYLPERRPDGPIEITDVAPRDAVIELIRHSFSPRLAEAAGLRESRFDRFARLALRVPVRRLLYPEGFERLHEVAAAILAG